MLKRRKPIPRMSKRRKAESVVYYRLRKEYLSENPYCEMVLRLLGYTQTDAIAHNGAIPGLKFKIGDESGDFHCRIPLATDIHHVHRRGKNYLNVETWMAVSRLSHEYIERNPSWARAKGFLK